jgi:acyl-CoA synthetase (AMP-forming)/AMP-acid ligase II
MKLGEPGWFGLGEVLDGHVRTRVGQIALVCGEHRLTWGEVAARADALAGLFAAHGIGRGDRVLWLGQNCHRLVEALFAAARLGAVLCPANWRLSPDELRFVIDDVDARVVLWQQEEIGDTVAAARTGDATWIQHDGEYEDLLAGAAPAGRSPVDPATPVLMLYTAAFDGRPSGALLSHTALLSQTTTLRLLEGIGADEVFLNSGPLFHIGTLRRTMATAHAGGCNVMVRRPEAAAMCRLIDAERCTSAFLQRPTQEQMVAVNAALDAADRHDLSSLRTAPGPPGWDEMVTVVKDGLVRSGYGQTELAGVVTFMMPDHPTTGGVPGPLAAVDVLDPDGVPVAVGATGEIAVRGPMVMTGYHRRPELTVHRQRHGWHHTGDLGRREPDGSIAFVGPLQRLIKSAGENIYPAEVEASLRRHPDVERAAVIGLPDPSWGQRVLAVVIPGQGTSPRSEDIVEHCRRELAGYKRPRAVEFVDALPTRGGTTDYDALDAQFGGGGYPGLGSSTAGQ